MKLQQLRYLVAIVDNGMNITAAAQALFTSQPGVSKQVKLLEDELSLPLFIRHGKSLEGLTDAGEEVVRRARRERTLIFSTYHLKNLREYLAQRNFRNFCSLIDLKGFSKIRNSGLLLAQALSMDVVIFIDNDEIIEDPNFLMVACEYLDRKWKGRGVCGKGGFYVNPDRTILLPPQPLWWRFFWNKTKWMNKAWGKILSSKDRLVPSPILLGGNLVLHRHLFRNIPFDPYIPRGEDTDYLINASQLGAQHHSPRRHPAEGRTPRRQAAPVAARAHPGDDLPEELDADAGVVRSRHRRARWPRALPVESGPAAAAR